MGSLDSGLPKLAIDTAVEKSSKFQLPLYQALYIAAFACSDNLTICTIYILSYIKAYNLHKSFHTFCHIKTSFESTSILVEIYGLEI